MVSIRFVTLLCAALFLVAVQAYVPEEIANKAMPILTRVNFNMAELTESERAQLSALGFSEGDLAAAETETMPRFQDRERKGATKDRLHKQLKLDAGEYQKQRSQLHANLSITFPALTAPSGYTDSGDRFFIKAFIPGPRCSDTGTIDGSFVAIDTICDDSQASNDGITDVNVLPVPLSIISSWFRVDDHCKVLDSTASHRMGCQCGVFKNTASGAYRIMCNGLAGWTRHWKRKGLTSTGCWFIDCQKQDNFNPTFDSQDFQGTTTLNMNMQGSNPCVTGSSIIAPIIMNFNVAAAVTSGSISLTLTGTKSKFPAMQGMWQPGSGTLADWFYFDITGRTVLSLTGGSLAAQPCNVPAQSFNCAVC